MRTISAPYDVDYFDMTQDFNALTMWTNLATNTEIPWQFTIKPCVRLSHGEVFVTPHLSM